MDNILIVVRGLLKMLYTIGGGCLGAFILFLIIGYIYSKSRGLQRISKRFIDAIERLND